MTNFSEHKKLFIKLMLSIVAFSVLILSAVLIPSSYASWQKPQGGNSLTIGEITTTQYYNVSFDSTGGTAVEDQTVEAGTKPKEPTAPTKDGYVFYNWYNEWDEIYSFGLVDREKYPDSYLQQVENDKNVIKSNGRVIHAAWGYVVCFASNNATLSNFANVAGLEGYVNSGSVKGSKYHAKYLENSNVPEPAITNRNNDGYAFGGWYKGYNEATHTFTDKYEFENGQSKEQLTSHLVLYSRWGNNVIFHYNDGATPDKTVFVQSILSGGVETRDYVTKPQNPTREGYDFAGWYTDENCTTEYSFETHVLGSGDGLSTDAASNWAFHLYAKWTETNNDPLPDILPDDAAITNGILTSKGSTLSEFTGSTVMVVPVSNLTVGDTFAIYIDKQRVSQNITVQNLGNEVEFDSATGIFTVKTTSSFSIRVVKQGNSWLVSKA